MLICKSILPRLGDSEDLPTTQKQTHRGSQNEETKKHIPNERTRENSRKRTKPNGGKQSTIHRVQNTGYRMLSELGDEQINSTRTSTKI